MLGKFVDWTHSLEPLWVGLTMFLLVGLAGIAILVSIAAISITLTKGWALLIVPAFLVYTTYLAFNQ
jgi:ABC-type transport system involved in multi-copper enzyme maturation permease subunit